MECPSWQQQQHNIHRRDRSLDRESHQPLRAPCSKAAQAPPASATAMAKTACFMALSLEPRLLLVAFTWQQLYTWLLLSQCNGQAGSS
eukprot:5037020-Amphidinium_carterae.1